MIRIQEVDSHSEAGCAIMDDHPSGGRPASSYTVLHTLYERCDCINVTLCGLSDMATTTSATHHHNITIRTMAWSCLPTLHLK